MSKYKGKKKNCSVCIMVIVEWRVSERTNTLHFILVKYERSIRQASEDQSSDS